MLTVALFGGWWGVVGAVGGVGRGAPQAFLGVF